jgi:hypothetical protein
VEFSWRLNHVSAGYNAKVSGQTSEVLETSEVYAFTGSSVLYLYQPCDSEFPNALDIIASPMLSLGN